MNADSIRHAISASVLLSFFIVALAGRECSASCGDYLKHGGSSLALWLKSDSVNLSGDKLPRQKSNCIYGNCGGTEAIAHPVSPPPERNSNSSVAAIANVSHLGSVDSIKLRLLDVAMPTEIYFDVPEPPPKLVAI